MCERDRDTCAGCIYNAHKAVVALLRFTGEGNTTSIPWCVISKCR